MTNKNQLSINETISAIRQAPDVKTAFRIALSRQYPGVSEHDLDDMADQGLRAMAERVARGHSTATVGPDKEGVVRLFIQQMRPNSGSNKNKKIEG